MLLSAIGPSSFGSTTGNDNECDDCQPRFALKTNMLYDAIVTPDLGVEMSLARKFSLSVEGVYAWWSKDSAHRYWRIRGAWAEMRYWFGSKSEIRALTGHHIGVYGSAFDYDFEFGPRGWQSPKGTYGVGVGYGYSFRLNGRLNLDLAVKAGYSTGKLIKYKPQCGRYVCTDRSKSHYFGVTGLEITLVWFPGKNTKNKPDFVPYDED